jgi:hypothetical protein
MIVRTSQNIRPPAKSAAPTSILALRLVEAYERHKAANEAKSQ